MLIRVFLHLAVHLLQIQQEQEEKHSAGSEPLRHHQQQHSAAAAAGHDDVILVMPSGHGQFSSTAADLGTSDAAPPSAAAATAGGGGLPGPGEEDDASSRDSAQFTNMLVSSWKEAVIPPAHRPPGAAINPKVLTSLRKRIHQVDKHVTPHGTTNRRARPGVHDTRDKIRVLSPRELHGMFPIRLTDTAARDAKIETLRALKFIDALHQEVRSKLHLRDSQTEADLRAELRCRIQKQRRDYFDLKQLARDEDEKLRAAYASLIASARPYSVQDQRLFQGDTRKIAERFLKKEREARRVTHDTARDHYESLQGRLTEIVRDVQRWQEGIFR
jgi:hypothetical protein